MAFSSAYDAAADFVSQLRLTLGCVIEQLHLTTPRTVRTHPDTSAPHILRLNNGVPAALRLDPDHYPQGNAPRLALSFVIYFWTLEDQESWRVSTSGYSYLLLERTPGGAYSEILAWQWDQRDVTSPTVYPHMHIKEMAGTLRHGLNSVHLPTGRVLIEDVVELLIRDFHAVPLDEDWANHLHRGRQAYLERRTQY